MNLLKKTLILSILFINFLFLNGNSQEKNNNLTGISIFQFGVSQEDFFHEASNFKISKKIKTRDVSTLNKSYDNFRKNRLYKGKISQDTSKIKEIPESNRFLFHPNIEKYFLKSFKSSNGVMFSNVEMFFLNDSLQYVVMDYNKTIENILFAKYGKPIGGNLFSNAEWINKNGSKIVCTKYKICLSLNHYSYLIPQNNEYYIIWLQSKINLSNIDLDNF